MNILIVSEMPTSLKESLDSTLAYRHASLIRSFANVELLFLCRSRQHYYQAVKASKCKIARKRFFFNFRSSKPTKQRDNKAYECQVNDIEATIGCTSRRAVDDTIRPNDIDDVEIEISDLSQYFDRSNADIIHIHGIKCTYSKHFRNTMSVYENFYTISNNHKGNKSNFDTLLPSKSQKPFDSKDTKIVTSRSSEINEDLNEIVRYLLMHTPSKIPFETTPIKKIKSVEINYLVVSPLTPNSCVDTAIIAFSMISFGERSGNLTILGKGDMYHELFELTKILDVNDRVRFIYDDNDDTVLNEIDKSHVVLICNHFYFQEKIHSKALLRGRPIIATKCGVEKHLDVENAIIINFGDIENFAHAMSGLEQYYPFDNLTIRRNAISQFGTVCYVDRMNKLYQSVLTKNG